MGLFDELVQNKLKVRLVFNLLLVLIVVACCFSIVWNDVEHKNSSLASSERITKLTELKFSYDEAKENYLNYVYSFKLTDLEKFNQSFATLETREKFLKIFSTERVEFKPDVEVLEKNIKATKHFFQNNVALIANSATSAPPQDILVGANAENFSSAGAILVNLIKKESEYLKAQYNDSRESDNVMAYLILGVAILSLPYIALSYTKVVSNAKKQIQHDKEVEYAKYSAQTANNAKSEYLAMISYEIRTPMNGVLGMSNLLLQSKLSTEQSDYVNTIHQSAESLLKIVNDVLDFSKIEAGKLSLDNVIVNIRELIQDVFAMLPSADANLKLITMVADEVPEFISCDPLRLRQILINLLSNAIKFTPSGTVELECAVIEDRKDSDFKLGFVVRDTGIGIPEENIPEVFKPFVQIGKSTTTNYGGTGLGLNISYNLVTMMGGKIKVKSTVDKGSVFTFYVVTTPAFKEKEAPKEQRNVNPQILDQSLATNFPFKVLVVDDNEINLMLIMRTLSKLGYDCEKAVNGEIALQMVKENNFDLIFMDMQMPVMDGPTATTEIRKFFKIYEYPVVIALTANALGDNRDRCLEAGMQDFISKPFKPVAIEEVIKKWAPKIEEYRSRSKVKEV